MSEKKTLSSLIHTKLSLEAMFTEEKTVDELEIQNLWDNNEIDLKDKIDGYGFIIDRYESSLEHLKIVKSNINEKFKVAKQRCESNIKYLKAKLYDYSQVPNTDMFGHIYRFHPYIATTHTIDVSKLTVDEGLYELPLLTKEELDNLMRIIETRTIQKEQEEFGAHTYQGLYAKIYQAKQVAKVTDLNKDSQALVTTNTKSVRIS